MPKKTLLPAHVYTRLRPISSGEVDGHGVGEAVDKQLAGYEDGAMLIKTTRTGEVERFEFPKEVIGPESTQEQVYDTVAPDLLDGFLAGDNNALLFAYGQTGTGKTHTMFGPSASLASPTPHDDWGLLPRVVNASIQHAAAETGKVFKLALSAIEFYCFAAWDLNADVRNLVTATPGGDIFGHRSTEISSVDEIAPFIERVYGNRKVSKTKMNAGSSRSHVCIILTLYQVDKASSDFSETTFSIVDLAGSERPGKTGAERVDALTASMEAKKALETGKDLSTGAQGSLINMELTLLTTAFSVAAESWQKGRAFKPQTDWAPTLWYLTGCCTGKARLGVVVAISQSPQNGWETWFSCTWGASIAKLKAPCIKQTPVNVSKAAKTTAKELEAAEAALAKTDPTSRSGAKFYAFRQGMVAYCQQRLEYLTTLQAAAGSDATGVEADETSDALMEIMALDIKRAFSLFDRNGDGTIDKSELIAILSRGNGLHTFPDEASAAKVCDDILEHFGTEGVLYEEGFVQWWREELRFKRMSVEEKYQWFEDNPQHADYKEQWEQTL